MKIRTLLTTLTATTALLIPAASAFTVLGTGTAALLGGDLTDPENDGVGTENTSGSNFNWVSITANQRAFFDEVGGGVNQGSFDIFDNAIDNGRGKYCCDGAVWNVTVEFAQPYVLTHFTAASSGDSPGRDPDVWQIQGSNNGTDWTDIFSFSNNDPAADGTRFDGDSSPWNARSQVIRWDGAGADFATPAAYNWFRLNADSSAGWDGTAGNLALSELELFGTPIPEPSAFALFGLAGIGLILRRRR